LGRRILGSGLAWGIYADRCDRGVGVGLSLDAPAGITTGGGSSATGRVSTSRPRARRASRAAVREEILRVRAGALACTGRVFDTDVLRRT
jgi:hypothetical protein